MDDTTGTLMNWRTCPICNVEYWGDHVCKTETPQFFYGPFDQKLDRIIELLEELVKVKE
jgi:hypothetical protein